MLAASRSKTSIELRSAPSRFAKPARDQIGSEFLEATTVNRTKGPWVATELTRVALPETVSGVSGCGEEAYSGGRARACRLRPCVKRHRGSDLDWVRCMMGPLGREIDRGTACLVADGN